jgi:hypothetical protein
LRPGLPLFVDRRLTNEQVLQWRQFTRPRHGEHLIDAPSQFDAAIGFIALPFNVRVELDP